MPSAVCELPANVLGIYESVKKANGGIRGGCWDVLAWKRNRVTFLECKWKDNDNISPKQRAWLESALKAKIRLEQFAICEWEIADATQSPSA
ncbi:MAG: hypothetical protein DMG76_33730 [Acidobacteria bacterium]|nr:MAG: hypothetical protein DMG76_33730 [Acidobacteriota bacterium]